MDQAVQQPGFYALGAPGNDTTQIALNQNKEESLLNFREINALKSEWRGDNIKWLSISDSGRIADSERRKLPLWKVCVILALAMLTAETYLLARPRVAVA